MSDPKLTPPAQEAMKAAVLVEVLGDVGEIREQVKAIHAGLAASNKKMQEQYDQAKQALFLARTESIEEIKKEAAKLVRDGVFSETGELKREIGKVIIDFNRAAEEVRSARRLDFLAYVFFSSLGVVVATFVIEKMILNH